LHTFPNPPITAYRKDRRVIPEGEISYRDFAPFKPHLIRCPENKTQLFIIIDNYSGPLSFSCFIVTLEGIREAVQVYEDTNLRERLAKYHGEKTDLVFKRWSETWLAPFFREWNIENYLSKVNCPVLAIQGKDDPYGTPAQVDAIVRQVSGPSSGLIIPDCGHIPHFQARETVTQAMTDFICKCLTI